MTDEPGVFERQPDATHVAPAAADEAFGAEPAFAAADEAGRGGTHEAPAAAAEGEPAPADEREPAAAVERETAPAEAPAPAFDLEGTTPRDTSAPPGSAETPDGASTPTETPDGTATAEAVEPPDGAATPEAVASRPDEQAARSTDGELARLHLRTGMLALARAELETLAGWSALDREALIDLAEVRWRTGDLIGAGEAAAAYLEVGGDDPIALCVAAEAALATGRKNDAENYAAKAMDRAADRLDDLFAGQPRSELWPEPLARAAPTPRAVGSGTAVPAVWPPPPGESEAGPHAGSDVDRESGASLPVRPAEVGAAVPLPAPTGTPTEPMSAAAAQEELAEAEQRIDRGELAGLGPRLAIVLRLQPALAPAVLSLADAALRDAGASGDEPGGAAQSGATSSADDLAAIHLVRSEACRLMGRETLSAAALQEARRLLHHDTPAQEST